VDDLRLPIEGGTHSSEGRPVNAAQLEGPSGKVDRGTVAERRRPGFPGEASIVGR
jgi:hypothetical protein